MTVKLIRMWSGEDVVADLTEEKTDSIVVKNPIVAVPTGQQGQIAFAPWSPILRKEGKGLEITKRYADCLQNQLTAELWQLCTSCIQFL